MTLLTFLDNKVQLQTIKVQSKLSQYNYNSHKHNLNNKHFWHMPPWAILGSKLNDINEKGEIYTGYKIKNSQ